MVKLTYDHKVTDDGERQRIISQGIELAPGATRINGNVSVAHVSPAHPDLSPINLSNLICQPTNQPINHRPSSEQGFGGSFCKGKQPRAERCALCVLPDTSHR